MSRYLSRSNRRRSTAKPTAAKKPPEKILNVVVPEGVHNKVRKMLAKAVHPDLNAAAADTMTKINSRLDKVKAIQEKATHIQFVVDSSGSMSGWKKELVTSYNKLLERQSRYSSQSTYGYRSFHDEIGPEPMDHPRYFESIRTSGNTPLFDTIGEVITNIDRQMDNPTDVVVIILTDGHDTGQGYDLKGQLFNPHYSAADLRPIIEEKLNIGWQFIYCTNQSNLSDSERIGIPSYAATTFSDYDQLLGKVNQMLLSYRQGDVKLLSFDGDNVITG